MVGRRPHVTVRASVVRQRLVEASHHARECNAPDQSMRDGREDRVFRNRSEPCADLTPERRSFATISVNRRS